MPRAIHPWQERAQKRIRRAHRHAADRQNREPELIAFGRAEQQQGCSHRHHDERKQAFGSEPIAGPARDQRRHDRDARPEHVAGGHLRQRPALHLGNVHLLKEQNRPDEGRRQDQGQDRPEQPVPHQHPACPMRTVQPRAGFGRLRLARRLPILRQKHHEQGDDHDQNRTRRHAPCHAPADSADESDEDQGQHRLAQRMPHRGDGDGAAPRGVEPAPHRGDRHMGKHPLPAEPEQKDAQPEHPDIHRKRHDPRRQREKQAHEKRQPRQAHRVHQRPSTEQERGRGERRDGVEPAPAAV